MTLGPLLLRADASPEIGAGHVLRCLALAHEWQARGGRVTLLTARLVPELAERLRADGVEIVESSLEPGSPADVEATAEEARRIQAPWTVVDGYAYGSDFQRSFKATGQRLLFVDDLGQAAPYGADLVLNQNLGAEPAAYRQRASTTQLLLGPRYALLRREFVSHSPAPRGIDGQARRILVLGGGTDVGGLVTLAGDALSQWSPELDIRSAAGRRMSPPAMVDLMAWADLAVSAAGSVVWELLYMGVPPALVVVAPNQVGAARALARRGAAVELGTLPGLTAGTLAAGVEPLLGSATLRAGLRRGGIGIVDGAGARRVCDRLELALQA